MPRPVGGRRYTPSEAVSASAGVAPEAVHPSRARVCLESEAGAEVGQAANDGRTALIEAAAAGHEAAMRVLLEAGADVEARSHDGKTALLWAAGRGSPLLRGTL